jgi:hypothetical protein
MSGEDSDCFVEEIVGRYAARHLRGRFLPAPRKRPRKSSAGRTKPAAAPLTKRCVASQDETAELLLVACNGGEQNVGHDRILRYKCTADELSCALLFV